MFGHRYISAKNTAASSTLVKKWFAPSSGDLSTDIFSALKKDNKIFFESTGAIYTNPDFAMDEAAAYTLRHDNPFIPLICITYTTDSHSAPISSVAIEIPHRCTAAGIEYTTIVRGTDSVQTWQKNVMARILFCSFTDVKEIVWDREQDCFSKNCEANSAVENYILKIENAELSRFFKVCFFAARTPNDKLKIEHICVINTETKTQKMIPISENTKYKSNLLEYTLEKIKEDILAHIEERGRLAYLLDEDLILSRNMFGKYAVSFEQLNADTLKYAVSFPGRTYHNQISVHLHLSKEQVSALKVLVQEDINKDERRILEESELLPTLADIINEQAYYEVRDIFRHCLLLLRLYGLYYNIDLAVINDLPPVFDSKRHYNDAFIDALIHLMSADVKDNTVGSSRASPFTSLSKRVKSLSSAASSSSSSASTSDNPLLSMASRLSLVFSSKTDEETYAENTRSFRRHIKMLLQEVFYCVPLWRAKLLAKVIHLNDETSSIEVQQKTFTILRTCEENDNIAIRDEVEGLIQERSRAIAIAENSETRTYHDLELYIRILQCEKIKAVMDSIKSLLSLEEENEYSVDKITAYFDDFSRNDSATPPSELTSFLEKLATGQDRDLKRADIIFSFYLRSIQKNKAAIMAHMMSSTISELLRLKEQNPNFLDTVDSTDIDILRKYSLDISSDDDLKKLLRLENHDDRSDFLSALQNIDYLFKNLGENIHPEFPQHKDVFSSFSKRYARFQRYITSFEKSATTVVRHDDPSAAGPSGHQQTTPSQESVVYSGTSFVISSYSP